VLPLVDYYLRAIKDPEKRLSYLQALDRKMRKEGHSDWVEAIAVWRLRRQLADEDESQKA
jgi:hypothetical protein